MEAKIDAWLKTYLNETLISPVDWETLPEECRIQLDNYARDEAVRRADSFANEGVLDLTHQDAIRQFVDAMAQTWKLPGTTVRQVVEDFYDALPPQPGEEFNKLVLRLYRRASSYTWKEIIQAVDPGSEAPIIGIVLKHADLPPDAPLDRTSFIKAMRYSYDSWTLTHPKDAVAEVIETLDLKNDSAIKLPDLQPIVRKRGASTWTRALELELEVDVKTASREDLIRILKRYSLIVRREGGLKPQEHSEQLDEPETIVQVSEPILEEKEEDQKVADIGETDFNDHTISEELNIDTIEFDEDSIEDKQAQPVAESPVEEEVLDEPTDTDVHRDEVVVEEDDRVAGDEQPVVPLPDNEPTKDSPGTDLSDEDRNALDSMFGEGDDDLPDVVKGYWDEQGNEGVEPDLPNEEPLGETAPSSDIPSDSEEIEEIEETSDTVSASKPSEMDANDSEVEEGTRLQDVFIPSPKGDRRDRFANLRSSDLRKRIVDEMYDGDTTMLDVFLAKLSGAPDWNRAKQFIANEFFRCKLDLHSELGEAFFLELKESLQD